LSSALLDSILSLLDRENNSSVATKSLLSIKRDDLALYMWWVYVFSFPFYIFASGSVQASAIPLLLTAAILSLESKPVDLSPYRPIIASFVIYILYVCTINFTYFLVEADTSFLKHSLFYIYNAIVLVVAFSVYARFGRRFHIATSWAFISSLTAQFVLWPIAPVPPKGPDYGWLVLFFNNPNQLGDYCVVVAVCVLYAYRERLIKARWAYWVTLLAGIISLYTLSRSSTAAILIDAMLVYPVYLLAAGGLVGAVVFLANSDQILVVTRFMGRMQDMSNALQNMRQINRVWENPEYTIFGAGEGGFDARFSTDKEIHSTFVEIFFSYGIVGMALFGFFLYIVLRNFTFRRLVYFGPLLAYGMFHDAIRVSVIWVLIAFVVCLSIEERKSALPAPQPAPA